ncbi:hypothetical protein Fmac_004719 [Flemingia macrophylla]|uniref:Secreted protein n=1 Tax=Flemingia macrophylla TaxID=520843 RepID=A0ABD1N5Q7_9FABA
MLSLSLFLFNFCKILLLLLCFSVLLDLKSFVSDPASLLSMWTVAGGLNFVHCAWSSALCMETVAFSVVGGGARLGDDLNASSNRRTA